MLLLVEVLDQLGPAALEIDDAIGIGHLGPYVFDHLLGMLLGRVFPLERLVVPGHGCARRDRSDVGDGGGDGVVYP